MTTSITEVVSTVATVEQFRALPAGDYYDNGGSHASNQTRTQDYRDTFTAWVDTYADANLNGIALLGMMPQLDAFRIEKRTKRITIPLPLGDNKTGADVRSRFPTSIIGVRQL